MPTAPVSVAVALADKLDTLTGFWAIDEKPTGSKDPFALRRAALGVIRLVFENDVSAPVLSILTAHMTPMQAYIQTETVLEDSEVQTDIDGKTATKTSFASVSRPSFDIHSEPQNLLTFFHDRLKTYLKDQGVRHDIIDACIAMPNNDDLTLLVNRAKALAETLNTDDGENLIQGFKRANNILTQAEETDGVEYSYGADPKFAETDEERALFTALDTAEAKITPAMETQDFTTAMSAMAALRTPIDTFFENTQINTDNGTVRRNRLNLLSRIRTLCLSAVSYTHLTLPTKA